MLALPVAAPQRLAANAEASIIGNGPYRLLVRRPGEKIELERNPHYHAAETVAVERVTYLTLEDLNTELQSLLLQLYLIPLRTMVQLLWCPLRPLQPLQLPLGHLLKNWPT